MSRTTRVVRDETPKGARYEWGHLFVETLGKPGQQRTMRAGTFRKEGTVVSEVVTEWLNPEHANVMSDLLRAAVVNAGGSSCGGKTLYEMVWDELDVITERLMAGEGAEDDVGAARGIAYIIAVMQNPYLPNIDNIKEQAMDRWEAGQ